MSPRARCALTLLALLALPPAASARGGRRVELPRARAVPFLLRDLSRAAALTQLQRFLPALDHCVADARTAHAANLDANRYLLANVELDAAGSVRAVNIDPSTIPLSLSRCLSDALWTFRVEPRRGRRPALSVLVRLTP